MPSVYVTQATHEGVAAAPTSVSVYVAQAGHEGVASGTPVGGVSVFVASAGHQGLPASPSAVSVFVTAAKHEGASLFGGSLFRIRGAGSSSTDRIVTMHRRGVSGDVPPRPATTTPTAPVAVTRSLGVLQAETTAQIDEVRAAGANTVYVPARWSDMQATAGGALDFTAVNSRIDYAISKGMKVILRPGVQYAPTWAQTEIPLYVDQNGATWSSTNSGERIRDWVWSAIGKQRVEAFYSALIAGLTTERKAAIVSVQTGFGIYGETQMPRVNLTPGIENLKWWGYSAPAQTGVGLASDQVVCPFPGHKPFDGVPAGTQGSVTDLAWVTWYRNAVRVRMNSLVGALRAGGWTGTVQVLHPSFGVRGNWNSGHFGWREQNAQGVDWRHQISGYTDAETYPWCTDVGKVDPWHTPTVESDYSAGWFIAQLAQQYGRTAHLGGENMGGGTASDQDRFFSDLNRYGYQHALYAFYSTLVDGTGDTIGNFATNAVAYLGTTPGTPAPTPTTPPVVSTIDTTATVNLTSVFRDLGPLGSTFAGVCSSTYGRRPSTSVPQAAAEQALDARYWRLPVRWNDAGYIATSALGAGSFSIEPDIDKYVSWGHRMILVIAGRGGDLGTWQAGDASKIAQRLLTLGYSLDSFDFSGPNEPGIDGSVADANKTPAKILERNQIIHTELQTVQPGQKLWGPVHFMYNRAELNFHQQGMGAALAGTNYHHYAMGGSGESQTTEWAFDHTATYEAEVAQLMADATAAGVSTEVNVDEFNWAVKPNYAVVGSDGYVFPEDGQVREARLFRAENTVYIASVMGRIMRAGGRGMVYATQNKSLGVMVENDYDGNTANLPEAGGIQRPNSSPMPAYWGVAAWTGGGVPALTGGVQPKSFPHMARRFYTVTQSDPLTEVYAVDNEAGGYNLVVINKRAGAARNVRLDLTGVPAGWIWERHRTRKTNPYDGFVKEGPYTIGSSRIDLAMEPCTVTVVVLKPAP